MNRMAYDTFDVPTSGGTLRVARWGAGDRVIVAAHGATGTHADFHALADQLGSEFSVIAPDLRGRGGSRSIPGPFGMEAHADDLAAVLDRLDIRAATVVGHSMGGFVAVVTALRHSSRVSNLVLVDGGLPLDLGPFADRSVEELTIMLLGPSLERLRMTFPTAEAYLDFWRPHPALSDDWNEYVERRLTYDLIGNPPNLRSSVSEYAVLKDTESDLQGDEVEVALKSLTHPVVFIRVPRGQFNQEPPLYPEAIVADWQTRIPQMRSILVPDVNHFTVLLTERGAKAVADVIRAEVANQA